MFFYEDPKVDKLMPVVPYPANMSEEEKKAKWLAEEEEPNPFEGCKNESKIYIYIYKNIYIYIYIYIYI